MKLWLLWYITWFGQAIETVKFYIDDELEKIKKEKKFMFLQTPVMFLYFYIGMGSPPVEATQVESR